MAFSLKEKVDHGDKFNEFDIQILDEVFQESQEI